MTAHRRTTGLTALLLSISILGLAGCGGATDASPAKAPGQERARMAESAEPRSVAEAQEQIARARADLEAPSSSPAAQATGTESQKAASDRHQDVRPSAGASAREEHGGIADACGTPCRALASMKRAVEALCRMTGDSDDRCVDAKRTLSESSARVSSCKCD